MHIIEKKLKKAQMAYEKDKSGRNALALFACYVLAGKTIDNDGIYLSKAYHVAITAHQEDPLDIEIISAMLYANVLLENYESAYELIRQLDAHSSFFSKSFPAFYGQVLYFNSIVQSKTDRTKAARKLQRNLEILYEKTEAPHLLAYLGSIQKLVFEDSVLCGKMYFEAMGKGLKSTYFYLDAYQLLEAEENYSAEMNELARKIIPWALNNGLSVDTLINRLEKRTLIGVLFSLDTGNLSKIYELYGHSGAFQCLCQKLIFAGDVSEKALNHYLKALSNRLNLRGLEQISIKAAYKNNCSLLPMFAVEDALRNTEEYDVYELAFLYGILISSGGEADEELVENAVKFGIKTLKEGRRGKEFNAIYKFLAVLFPDDGRFAKVVFEELFKYVIEFNGQTPYSVCVYEYQKNGVSVYKSENGAARINALDGFYCCFLGENPEEYLNISKYNIEKALEIDEADKLRLFESFYYRGFESNDLIIALAAEYIKKQELKKRDIDLLQIASNLPELSKSFKTDICTRLAEHYSGIEQYSLAVHYYRIIGSDAIKPDKTLGALKSFVSTGRYNEAAALIASRGALIPEAELFNALKALQDYSDNPEIASMCYNLIMDGYCGNEILSIFLRSYRGTPEEWLIIAKKIDSLGFDVSQLYEKIIVNGIFTGSIGNDCNEAFVRLYRLNKTHQVIPKYVYFCCYEVIKNGKLLPDGVVDVLGDIYAADDSDPILCCTLAINHIRSGRQDKTVLIGEAAIYQEEGGFIFPDFKLYQDKSFVSSYIEKNTPFVYHTAAHKQVWLCYKSDDEKSYSKIKMKYFRFGMYFAVCPLFYGERITYYFHEEGGVKTEAQKLEKTQMRLIEQFNDPYYIVNNAVIYEHMMKFDMVENLIEDKLAEDENFPIITL